MDLSENLVSRVISDGLMGHAQRRSPSGWININCPMCVSRGETPDRKQRCGVRFDVTTVGVLCYNCNFRTIYHNGQHLSQNMRSFMAALGVEKAAIGEAFIWAETLCRSYNEQGIEPVVYAPPDYSVAISLPPDAKRLQDWIVDNCTEPWFQRALNHLLSRGDEIAEATDYYWSPSFSHLLIIPCYHQQRVVGWIGRSLYENPTQKYHKEVPTNYLFNVDALTHPKREFVFITEGVFDALAINGVAALGATLNERQIAWVNQSGKQAVVVPDRDKAGKRLIEIALQQQWAVAMPSYGRHQWWDDGVKDAADAVQRYGKLYTVQSILTTLAWHAGVIKVRASFTV